MHRWRTQPAAIRNVNCRIQWIIEFLNANCAPGYPREHVCLSVIQTYTRPLILCFFLIKDAGFRVCRRWGRLGHLVVRAPLNGATRRRIYEWRSGTLLPAALLVFNFTVSDGSAGVVRVKTNYTPAGLLRGNVCSDSTVIFAAIVHFCLCILYMGSLCGVWEPNLYHDLRSVKTTRWI